jgi:hypothetical protein
MPVPSRRLKDLIEGTVDHHASQRWPALEEVTIRWRGSYGYLTGYLSEDDDDTITLCRIQYLGDPDEWAFAIWQASTDSYAESVLLDGRPAGHPNLALDTACTLYLAGTSDHPVHPDKPLKDLRGAALDHSAGRQATRATTQLFAAQHLLDLRSYYVDYRRHHKPRHLCRALVGIRYPCRRAVKPGMRSPLGLIKECPAVPSATGPC